MNKKCLIAEKENCFLLSAENFSYAFKVSENGILQHLHFGGRIERTEDLPSLEKILSYRHRAPHHKIFAAQEYPAWNGNFFDEPALKINFPDGMRCAVLKYRDFSINELNDGSKELVAVLAEQSYPLRVKLHYRLFPGLSLMERWSEIINEGAGPITLDSVMSAAFYFPRIRNEYRLSYLTGRWGKEGTINHSPVNQGKIVLESRTGLSGPCAMPFFALDDGSADEHSGRVWFGSLLWSGNWKLTVEKNAYEQTSVLGGINDFDFSWPLKGGETFTTPAFSAGLSLNGFGESSRILHRYERDHLLPQKTASKAMPLIFNSWSCMGIEVDENKIFALAEKAAAVGAELFVIDDGWQRALGDWIPDPKKFPNGLKPVIDKVKACGMNFGLWVEVESFEINSTLYREHPEWAMRFGKHQPFIRRRDDIDRQSMMINFARDDVREYIYHTLHRLLRDTGITYLKLDMNSALTDPGWDEVPEAEKQTIWVKYVNSIHYIFGRLSRDFPDVLMENCASGAARSDLAMSRYFGRMNRSDNQDTLDILRLHEGFTWLHASRLAGGGCHISDDAIYHINLRRPPMKFQAYAGMMGSLSIGKNLPKCSQEELREIAGYAELYKKIRHIPQFGDLYRLASHYDNPYAAFEYVSTDKTEALLFIFGHSLQFGDKVPNFILYGLDPDMLYETEYFGNVPQKIKRTASVSDYPPVSGRGLMEIGVQVELLGDYDARILYFKGKN
ncbi:MAG: alpha-galactosidase [Victivallales bacterium]|nr:alpha-galactosidase [Victivallales bacterium]